MPVRGFAGRAVPGRGRSVWLFLPAVFAAVSFLAASDPVFDIDSYWHVRLGQEIVAVRSLHGPGEGWSFGPHLAGWVTTMWLSEVIMAGLHAAFGWHGQLVMRLLLTAAAGVLLARRLLNGPGGTRPGALVFGVALFAVAADAQDRPSMASFVFLVVIGGWLLRVRDGDDLPSWRLVAAVVFVWANIHGYWVLGPAAFGLAAATRAIDTAGPARGRWRAARPGLALAAAGTAAGCLTPVGPALVLAPLRVAGAAEHIAEWQPTSILAYSTIALLAMVAGAAVAWSRSPDRVPAGEMTVVLSLLAFGMLAYRNVTPAILLMAPLVAVRIARAFPERPGTRVASPWVRHAAAALVAVAFTGAVTKIVASPALPDHVPLRALAALDAEPGERRVLNAYNVSGQVLAFTGPHVRVAIDGRTDRYGSAWIDRHDRLEGAKGDWQDTLAELDPTDALIGRETALAYALRDRGWSVTMTDGRWVLLRAPEDS